MRQVDQGSSTAQAAAAVGISAKADWQIAKQYLEGGLKRAIYNAPRLGQKSLLDAEQVQRIIAMVCGPPDIARSSQPAVGLLLRPLHASKHGSWLNQAEIEVSLLRRLCLGQRRIPDLETSPHCTAKYALAVAV